LRKKRSHRDRLSKERKGNTSCEEKKKKREKRNRSFEKRRTFRESPQSGEREEAIDFRKIQRRKKTHREGDTPRKKKKRLYKVPLRAGQYVSDEVSA